MSTPKSTAAGHTLTRDDILTVADVVELLNVPKSTVGEWARRDAIPSRKRGKHRFFPRWEILAWLEAADG